jgi:hypothetical protein
MRFRGEMLGEWRGNGAENIRFGLRTHAEAEKCFGKGLACKVRPARPG